MDNNSIVTLQTEWISQDNISNIIMHDSINYLFHNNIDNKPCWLFPIKTIPDNIDKIYRYINCCNY